jgi:2-iminobutanoate/2-iminopropanoate deaminase
MVLMASSRAFIGLIAATLLFGLAIPLHAKEFIKGEFAGDLEGQVRQIFKLLNATLEKAGGKLSDMVQMTVFITDVRYGDRLTQIRREIFGDNFPGSALITITALAIPDAKVEIQGYAVIGSK